ncbi:hypothetical protein C9374_002819 [Naegleria lovaniensis]|uniref:PIH1 domain-containing protein 1 n=1 Tax=Naegleria lovaniensis TaxID=51637 RepID=A0AA88GU74_NAELO|nr:uncharacterized protein C9374_002819 [Naegleria lovaniensis]KAG2386373.1 hypothetical protein C9374_002819 [Naegleria lovaniensis]
MSTTFVKSAKSTSGNTIGTSLPSFSKDRKLDITKEELNKIEQCMKDPEFLRLFEEYAKEISDPNTLKETDLYIKQLEQEGSKLPDSIVIPKASFCIQCSSTDKKAKQYFVNICSSDKVEMYKEEKATQQNKKGTQFKIPLIVGHPRDSEKETVIDVVFNTKTCERALKDLLFKNFICELSLDYVEKKCNVTLKKNYYTEVLGLKSKGDPSSLTIQSLLSNDREKFEPNSLLKSFGKEIETHMKEDDHDKELQMPQPKTSTKSNLIQEVNEPMTPKFEIVYKNAFDMSEYTYSAYTSSNRTKPSEIGVRIFLPHLDSAAGVDLDVSENFLKLDSTQSAKYHLEVHLPYSVFSDKVSAKFDKKTKTLKVTLAVIPDPIQPVAFEDIPKEEEETTQHKHVDTNVKTSKLVEEIASTSSPQEEKLDQATKLPSLTQISAQKLSSFVQTVPSEVDVALTSSQAHSLSALTQPQESNKIVVTEPSVTKKKVSFMESSNSSQAQQVPQQATDFKNKYLFDLD